MNRRGGRRPLTLRHFHCFVLIFVCKINAAEEGRKAESYDKFKLAFLIIYGKLEILLIYIFFKYSCLLLYMLITGVLFLYWYFFTFLRVT
jgi:hypothetical protein